MGCFLHLLFGFLRSDEIIVPSDLEYDPSVHLSFGDVRLDSVTDPQFLEVTIKASKTDPFRQGVQVFLGRTNSDLCPVAAVLNYMVRKGTDNKTLLQVRQGSSAHEGEICQGCPIGLASRRDQLRTIL